MAGEALKPCPFCGGDAEIYKVSCEMCDDYTVSIECNVCNVSTKSYEFEKNCIDSWNNRV